MKVLKTNIYKSFIINSTDLAEYHFNLFVV